MYPGQGAPGFGAYPPNATSGAPGFGAYPPGPGAPPPGWMPPQGQGYGYGQQPQGYPGQPGYNMPPQGQPHMPPQGQPFMPPQGQPYMAPQAGPHSELAAIGLGAFCQQNRGDETWDGKPSDVPKEMRLINERRNDMYPQGRDNCLKFLTECQRRNLSFKIKALHTSPYWTWFYEIASAGAAGPNPNNAKNLVLSELVSAGLSAFIIQNKGDESWECSPSDVPKEMRLINERRNDMYPQGRDNCLKFLTECQRKNFRFVIRAAHTRPYWTWYYEVKEACAGNNTAATPVPRGPVGELTAMGLGAFCQQNRGDESWDCTSSDVNKETRLLNDRKNDLFPQGRDNCLKFLRECQKKGYRFRIKALHTSPYWTWYYEVKP